MAEKPAWLAALWPSDGERARLLAEACERVARRLESLAAPGPIPAQLDRDTIRRCLAGFDFEHPADTGETVAALTGLMDVGLVQSAHARCFGLFNPTPAFPGILADLLAASWNPQLAVWSHAPVAVEAELHVLGHMARTLGMSDEPGASHFTVGGSEANATALHVTLTRLFPAFAAEGVRALERGLCIYASAESHLAWLKIVHRAGLGRRALRLIAVDGAGRMDVAALEAALADDRAQGLVPAMIVATAGTTNAGMIDPLAQIADVAGRVGAHYHIDAAWAGAATLNPSMRPLLAGLARADSVTVDAHKWLAAPMGAGMFFCRERAWLAQAFHVATDYMPPAGEGVDFYIHSEQWSRRFIGLRLFLILTALGRQGAAAQIAYQSEMGLYLKTRLAASDWRIVNDTPLPVACFVDRGGADAEAIVRGVLARGRVWISSTRTHGVACLRGCVTSFLTTRDDIDILVEELGQARSALT